MTVFPEGPGVPTRSRDRSTQCSMALRLSSYQASLPSQQRSGPGAWEALAAPLFPPGPGPHSPGLSSQIWLLLNGHCQQRPEAQGLELPDTVPHLLPRLPGHKLSIDGCSEKSPREPRAQESLRPGLELGDRDQRLSARSMQPLTQASGSLLTASPWVTRGGQAHSRSTSRARISSAVPLRRKDPPSKHRGCQLPAGGPAWEQRARQVWSMVSPLWPPHEGKGLWRQQVYQLSPVQPGTVTD
jgi:hypothetical protein